MFNQFVRIQKILYDIQSEETRWEASGSTILLTHSKLIHENESTTTYTRKDLLSL